MGRLSREEISQARARLQNEELITHRKAAGILDAAPPSVLNWMLRGVGGVHLDAVMIDGAWYTSEAAIKRFQLARAEKSAKDG